MTFSSTVMESKLRTTWNVRAMPSSEHCSGGSPDMRRPFSRTSPASGTTSPEIALNSEVLPAPFGPISPRISPSRTSKLISTLAATPPNDLLTRSTSSSGGIVRSGRRAHANADQAGQSLRPRQRHDDDQRAVDHQIHAAPRSAEIGARQLGQAGSAPPRPPAAPTACRRRPAPPATGSVWTTAHTARCPDRCSRRTAHRSPRRYRSARR